MKATQIESLKQKALRLSSQRKELSSIPMTVPVVYVDRLSPNLILSSSVEKISKAKWAYYSHKMMVLDIVDVDGVKAYRIAI